MDIVDLLSGIPEYHLAADELMLRRSEKGQIGETLRFWEPEEFFVVVGRSGRVEDECFFERCRTDGIKIFRRISGGGTVLQGRGCLNYSAVISYSRYENSVNVRYSYEKIMGSMAEGFRRNGLEVEFKPLSDLTFDGKKISGNAQARKKKYFLHHGTLLMNMDLNKVGLYLRYPPFEPEYRKGRSHMEFMTNLPVDPGTAKDIIKDAFGCTDNLRELADTDLKEIEILAENKYRKKEWNLCF